MFKKPLLPSVLLIASLGFAFAQSTEPRKRISHPNAVPYKVLRDYMGCTVDVGLDPDVNEIQLRDTLAKAADDHQDDAARDYLSSDMFWIEAYLMGSGKNSAKVAGRLRRYVPRMSSEEMKKMTNDERRKDLISIFLDEAKRTLISDSMRANPLPLLDRMPQYLWGRWIVKRWLPTRTISCWGQEEVNKFLGTELEYSLDLFRWKDAKIRAPRILTDKLNAQEFHDFHSGGSATGSQLTLRELGITSDHVEIVKVQHSPADITGGTIEVPGDYLIRKDENTIIFPVCNVWFEAKRVTGKK